MAAYTSLKTIRDILAKNPQSCKEPDEMKKRLKTLKEFSNSPGLLRLNVHETTQLYDWIDKYQKKVDREDNYTQRKPIKTIKSDSDVRSPIPSHSGVLFDDDNNTNYTNNNYTNNNYTNLHDDNDADIQSVLEYSKVIYESQFSENVVDNPEDENVVIESELLEAIIKESIPSSSESSESIESIPLVISQLLQPNSFEDNLFIGDICEGGYTLHLILIHFLLKSSLSPSTIEFDLKDIYDIIVQNCQPINSYSINTNDLNNYITSILNKELLTQLMEKYQIKKISNIKFNFRNFFSESVEVRLSNDVIRNLNGKCIPGNIQSYDIYCYISPYHFYIKK